MKKNNLLFLFIVLFFCNSLSFSVKDVFAVDDAEINEKNNKIDSLKSQEKMSAQEINVIEQELAALEQREKKLASENQRLIELSTELNIIITDLNAKIYKRNKQLTEQVRSMQTEKKNVVKVILSNDSLADVCTCFFGVVKLLSAGKNNVNQQKKDVDKVSKAREENYERMLRMQKNQQELEESKKKTEQRKADLSVAKINFECALASEEGARDALLARKAQAQEEAAAVTRRQQEEENQLHSAQVESQKPLSATSTPASTSTSKSARSSSSPSISSSSGASGGIISGDKMNWTVDHGFYWGQCTWYANKYFGYRVPWHWGNGLTWGSSAKADGRHVSGSPEPNTIACFQPDVDGASCFGHVAVVMNVNHDGTYDITESNVCGLGVISWRRNLRPQTGVEFIRMD